jgi:hypothetical protein
MTLAWLGLRDLTGCGAFKDKGVVVDPDKCKLKQTEPFELK